MLVNHAWEDRKTKGKLEINQEQQNVIKPLGYALNNKHISIGAF